MPIDWNKLSEDMKKPRTEWLYKCSACGEESWYLAQVGHLDLKCHEPNFKSCKGSLVEVKTRLVDRKTDKVIEEG